MLTLGRCHTLRVLRITTPGAYLDGQNLGDILLPGVYVPPGLATGQDIEVFVHRDSEDRLVASTDFPYVMAGEFGMLRVSNINERFGAFLSWGLPKDLLLPEREISTPVHIGDWVVVYVSVDPRSDRLVASMKLNRFLNLTPPSYTEGQKVNLLIASETDLGFTAIIENAHKGLLYHSDLGAPVAIGERFTGYIRTVRPDGKIDLSLDASGYKRIAPLSEQILQILAEHGGRMAFTDKSSPEEIRAAFGASKKAFKQAIGALYKERKISIEAHGIRLTKALPKPNSPSNT